VGCELALECADLRTLSEHAAAEHSVYRGALLLTDQGLGDRDEGIIHARNLQSWKKSRSLVP
jgi:hypothetical protein